MESELPVVTATTSRNGIGRRVRPARANSGGGVPYRGRQCVAVVATLLAMAAAALSSSPRQYRQHTNSASQLLCGKAACDATSDSRCAYVVGGHWPARLDHAYGRQFGDLTRLSAISTAEPGMKTWQRVGAYTLEFTGAAIGTAVAGLLGVATIEGVYQAGYNGPNSVPAAGVYFLSSAALSATGTHLFGRLAGRRSPFTGALLGGVIGGVAGSAAFLDYFATRRHPHRFMAPISLALPALGAVVGYNLWKNNGTR